MPQSNSLLSTLITETLRMVNHLHHGSDPITFIPPLCPIRHSREGGNPLTALAKEIATSANSLVAMTKQTALTLNDHTQLFD
jgi:hypothetical protein